MKLFTDLEIEMTADMYNKMTACCLQKCIPPKYKEAELSKGEAVCLDRCVAKYMEIHDRIGKKLTQLSTEDEARRGMLEWIVKQVKRRLTMKSFAMLIALCLLMKAQAMEKTIDEIMEEANNDSKSRFYVLNINFFK
uniref:Mitochondrial import inner membrane translocase subunit n=1 Tax=Magallana gigas TaxID=29159 RepID=K1PRW1_MAGGI